MAGPVIASSGRCPTCKQDVLPRAENKSFPFCSNRCRLVDLGKWLNEEYVLSRPLDPELDHEAIEAALREQSAPEDPLERV